MIGTTLGSLDVIPLGKYDGIELGSLECSTDGTADGNLEVFFIEAWLGSLVGIDLSNNEGTKLGFWDGKSLAHS